MNGIPAVCVIMLVLMASLQGQAAPANGTPTADLVLDRYVELLDREAPPDPADVRSWHGSLSADGSWTDIDYGSQQKTAWPARVHLDRVIALLRSARVDGSDHVDLGGAALLAVDFWTRHRFQSINWYWNQIGVPQRMRDVAVLLGPALAGDRRKAVLEVIGQHGIRGSGANLVWSAELAFHYGCLTGDQVVMTRAADRVWEVVTLGEFEGIQIDGTFFQHDTRVQNYIYGKGFAKVVVRLAWQLRGTEWAMPEDKQEFIDIYLLDGCQWMSRHRVNSPIGVDRAVSQSSGFNRADMRSILRIWREVSVERSVGPDPWSPTAANRNEQLNHYLARQNGDRPPMTGFRYFSRGDLAAYHRPEGSIFLKTLSDRTHLTESFIGVNFGGWPYLTCGDHYVLRDGSEYRGLQPVWRWSQLPGVTTPAYPSEQVRKRFVGGLGDGESGCAAMDYLRDGAAGYFSVRKFWAFHDGVMVGLLGGWDVTTFWGQITTGLEQCRLQGPVVVARKGQIEKLGSDVSAYLDVDWAIHRGVGYLVTGAGRSVLRAGPQSGDWRRIDRDGSPLPVVEDVLAFSLEHSHEPQDTGYAIVLGADVEKMRELQAAPSWAVVRNDAMAQVIRFDDGRFMGAFYAATVASDSGPVSVSRPCILMWDDTTVRACDPTHRGGSLTVMFDGNTEQYTVSLPEAGISETWDR